LGAVEDVVLAIGNTRWADLNDETRLSVIDRAGSQKINSETLTYLNISSNVFKTFFLQFNPILNQDPEVVMRDRINSLPPAESLPLITLTRAIQSNLSDKLAVRDIGYRIGSH